MTESDPGSPEATPHADLLKQALKAFKKRLKLTRLDNDSKLGYGPMSRGTGGIVGITPPNQFPQSIWEELVQAGKLRYVGQGVYELTPGT